MDFINDKHWSGIHTREFSFYATDSKAMIGPRGLFGFSLFVFGQRLQLYFGRWYVEVMHNK